MNENVCAGIAGGACVAGISLSVLNVWLAFFSLLISIVAGVLALTKHFRTYYERELLDEELEQFRKTEEDGRP